MSLRDIAMAAVESHLERMRKGPRDPDWFEKQDPFDAFTPFWTRDDVEAPEKPQDEPETTVE